MGASGATGATGYLELYRKKGVARVRHVISILLLLLALGRQIGHRCWTTEPEWIGCW
jgi:hypothetical protein